MSSCSSFWGKLVKNFNKTPALRPGTKGLRPGARLSIHNVAPLVKKFNKTQLFPPQTQLISPLFPSMQLLFAPNAAKFLLSQAIDMGKVAAPLIVKNFNKIPGPNFTLQLLPRSKSQLISQLLWSKFPPHHPSRRSRRRGGVQMQLPWNLLNILTELVKCVNLAPGTPSVREY